MQNPCVCGSIQTTLPAEPVWPKTWRSSRSLQLSGVPEVIEPPAQAPRLGAANRFGQIGEVVQAVAGHQANRGGRHELHVAPSAGVQHQGADDGEVLGRAEQAAGRRAEFLPVPAVPMALDAHLVFGQRGANQTLARESLRAQAGGPQAERLDDLTPHEVVDGTPRQALDDLGDQDRAAACIALTCARGETARSARIAPSMNLRKGASCRRSSALLGNSSGSPEVCVNRWRTCTSSLPWPVNSGT